MNVDEVLRLAENINLRQLSDPDQNFSTMLNKSTFFRYACVVSFLEAKVISKESFLADL